MSYELDFCTKEVGRSVSGDIGAVPRVITEYSMSPPLQGRLKIVFATAALVAITVVLLFLSSCKPKETHAAGPSKPPSVPVTVATVTQRTIPIQIRTIGNVEAYSTIQVKAQVGGELIKVNFQEGDTVTKGQLLFEIDPRQYQEQVKQFEANLAKDAANAANASADARRYQELSKAGVVARADTELKEATAKSMEATLAADRAAIDNARLQVEYCSIHSPIDGRTGNLAVKLGNLVKANDIPMVTINQVHPIYVDFSVPQSDFPEIQKRLNSGLRVEAGVPNTKEPPVFGTLTFADNAVDVATGTIKLKGTFQNKDNRLWPGLFVNVVLTVTQQPNAILVPSQAVQTGQNGQFVFVVQPDMKVQMRTVVMTRAVGNDIALASGVKPGETVVTDGQSRLVPGALVQIVKTPVGGDASNLPLPINTDEKPTGQPILAGGFSGAGGFACQSRARVSFNGVPIDLRLRRGTVRALWAQACLGFAATVGQKIAFSSPVGLSSTGATSAS